MLQITKKDKIFIIVALPMAVAACYWFFVRKPLADELSACEMQDMSLADATQYEAEGAMLDKQLASVRERLQAQIKDAESSRMAVKASAESSAERLEKVLKVFSENNVRVVKSVERANGVDSPAESIMRQSFGVAEPVCMNFTADGFYRDFISVLNAFANPDSRVIVESVSMTSRRAGCGWVVSVWF